MSVTPPSSEHDQRLERVLADYLHAVAAGTAPDRSALLRAHPDLAADLDSFFRNRDALEHIAAPLKQQLPEAETIGAAGVTNGSATIRYFGDYELLEEIARGGMGVVYRARHVSLGRIVAVKMILAGQLAAPADVARFRAEAEAAANLDHPHIVPIYEIGEHESQHYFSMKFIEGGTLAQRPRIALRGSVECLVKVARAVHHAHQRGILHRDLKPGNILIDTAGQPHVTDFGLARRVEGDSRMTQSGAIVGTPSYMAPEQARSEKLLTTGVDVYSLGAILYELLTGRPPFRAATALDTVIQVLDEEPVPPRSVRADIDRDLETICLKCLAKDLERRYDSAAALADDLERWLRGEPIMARRTPWARRVVKWVRRKPALAGLVALGAASAAALVVLGVLLYQQQLDANQQQAQALSDITDQKNRVQAQLLQTRIEQARTERLVGNRSRALELIAEAVRMQPTADLRRDAIESITSFGVRQVARLPAVNSSILPVRDLFVGFSADGQYVAHNRNYLKQTGDATGKQVHEQWKTEVKVWRIATGELLAQYVSEFHDASDSLQRGPRPFAFSPVAPLLAVVRANHVHLLDLATKREVCTMPGDKVLGFSPNGAMLAVAGNDGAALWSIAERKQLPCKAGVQQAVFASDDTLVTWDGKRLSVWNVPAGREEYTLPEPLAPLLGTSLRAPAMVGDRLVVRRPVKEPGAVHLALWSVAKRAIVKELGAVRRSFEADGALPVCGAAGLLALVQEGKRSDLRLIDTTTGDDAGTLVAEGALDHPVQQGQFNPQGRILAVQEGWHEGATPASGVRLWDLHTGTTLRFFINHYGPCWSPDGRYLALWDDIRIHLLIYEVTPGAFAVPCNHAMPALTFSADGRTLASARQTWELRRQGPLSWLQQRRPDPEDPGGVFQHAGNHRLWTGGGHVIYAFDPMQDTISSFIHVTQAFPERHTYKLLEFAGRLNISFQGFAVSPDGRRLVWTCYAPAEGPATQKQEREARVELWDLVTNRRRAILHRGSADRHVRFSADGRRVFLGDQGHAAICGLEPVDGVYPYREFVENMELKDGTRSYLPMNFETSGDLKTVYCNAVAGDAWYLLRFDTTTARIEVARPVPRGAIAALALSRDGTLLATGGADQQVRLWDPATLQELATWPAHHAAVAALALSPDGAVLASAGDDRVLRLWDLPFIRAELAKLNLAW